ncbi:hypothetical protein [Haloarchaeobius sp. TZWWS8]|uniref:hypothetical protein n=1 Tax=Haloarchaeobius sp. TZWWS8 TaxID=3446121 RepID=UPI003EBFC61A
MQGLDRRELLAAMAGMGLASIAGCTVCASSWSSFDDYLRLSIPSFEETETGFRGEVEVLHRGPDNWDWGDQERETFYTNYDDVHLVGYGPSERQLLDVPLGAFEPGTTKRATVDVDTFPMVFTAFPGDVSFDTTCAQARTGAQVLVYAGNYEAEPPDGWGPTTNLPDSIRRIERRVERLGGGHRWLPYAELNHPKQRTVTPELFARARCVQRELEGRDPTGPPDFSSFAAATEWLEWNETATITVYGSETAAPRSGNRRRASEIPAPVRDIVTTTDWQALEFPKVSKTVSVAELQAIVASMEGDESRSFPECGEPGTECSDSWRYRGRGHCVGGWVKGYYEFDPDRVVTETGDRRPLYWSARSLVLVEYRWEGVL